jgi:hypothetical protein
MDFSSTRDMRKVTYYWQLYNVIWYYTKLITLRDRNIVNAIFEDRIYSVKDTTIRPKI